MTGSPVDIRLAYRHLLNASYRAVKYAKPARYVMLDRLRTAFRTCPPEAYDTTKLARTLEFLRGAEAANGLEHRILRNMTHYWYQDMPRAKKHRLKPDLAVHRDQAKKDVEDVLREMGRTMNMYV